MEISKTQFNSLYNDSTGGRFPTNTDQQIGSDDLRQQSEDIKDSTFFLLDNAYNGAKGTKLGASTIAALKAVVTTSIETGVFVVFRDTGNGNVLRVYELVSGTDAESSPDVVRPDDYAASTNEKVWKLAGNFTYDSKVVTAAGTDTYTADLIPAISSYVTGAHYFIQFTNANTGAATLNLNSLGAKSIVKNGSAALEVTDINAGQIYELVYDGTNLQISGRIGGGGGGGITNTAGNNELMKSNGTNAVGSGMYESGGDYSIGGLVSPGTKFRVVSSLGQVKVDAENAAVVYQIRSNSGQKGWLSFTEDSVADKWLIGTENGDTRLFFCTGSSGAYVKTIAVDSTGKLGINSGDETLVSRLTLRDDATFANRFIELLHGSTSKHLTYFVEGTTTDGTLTTIQSVTAPDDSSFSVKATIVGVCTAGTGASVGDTNTYEFIAKFKKVSGTLSGGTSGGLITIVSSIEDQTEWGAGVYSNSGNIDVMVTGEASTTIRWTCKTEVIITTH